MGKPTVDPSVAPFLKKEAARVQTAAAPPPPRNPHLWYDRMQAKLFADTANLYNTMTADDFERQAQFRLAFLRERVRRNKWVIAAGGDSDNTRALDWPTWFNEIQGILISQPEWDWIHEESHRLLYMYACWRIASGLQDKSPFVAPPEDKPAAKGAPAVNHEVADPAPEDDGSDAAPGDGVKHIDIIARLSNGEDVELPPELQESPPTPLGIIPLIAIAAENEVPPESTPPADGGAAAATGGATTDPAPARAYRPNGKTIGTFDKKKLPPNLEFIFRYLGKSAPNVKAQRNFASRNADLNTHVTVIDELGHGNGNWCGPASNRPFMNCLAKPSWLEIKSNNADPTGRWCNDARVLYSHYNPKRLEQMRAQKNVNLDLDGNFRPIEEVDVEAGDIIWMINKVGPLSGHVATIISSQDASGSKSGMPAMVTYVSGNAGGAQGGTVRIQTVWRLAIPDEKYDYDKVSGLGNDRDVLRTDLRKATSGIKDAQIVGNTDALNSSQMKGIDENQKFEVKKGENVAQVSGADLKASEDKLKEKTKDTQVRPTVAGTHWQVRLFKISALDLRKIHEEMATDTAAWCTRNGTVPDNVKQKHAPTEDDKKQITAVRDRYAKRFLRWVPPDVIRDFVIQLQPAPGKPAAKK